MPLSKAAATASSMACAAAPSFKLKRNINAADKICATGFAMPMPAISGALPPAGSYIPKPCSFKLAEGNKPIEPVIIAQMSDNMSPNKFGHNMTSNWLGSRTNCIAALSTYKCSNSTSAYSTATSSTT